MSNFLKNIDEKTRLAGANKLEVLTFSLGHQAHTEKEEVFGINVFKVREVIKAPPITEAPNMPAAVKGMVSLRGNLIPVIDLGEYTKIQSNVTQKVLILTEYNQKTQGFLVQKADSILRIDWANMKAPPEIIAAGLKGLLTSVANLNENKLVMMLDVEKILQELSPNENNLYQQIRRIRWPSNLGPVWYADDSSVARAQIENTLTALGVKGVGFANGQDLWNQMTALENESEAVIRSRVGLLLTDIEMPEMDGFMLTKKVKSHKNLKKIPVIMHSSLSGSQNQALGQSVGVDRYIPKFEPEKLAQAVMEQIGTTLEG